MDCYACLALVVLLLIVIYQLVLKDYIAGGVCTSKATMAGRTVIVTGANGGIAIETVLDLAMRGARVIMACRNLKKSEPILKDIVEKTGNTNVVLKHLDLASLDSIRTFAEDINKNEAELHVLINNAGLVAIPERRKTQDGFEMTMGVNHLGHFLLTNLLIDLLKKSSPSRIINMSSAAHKAWTTEMNFENLNAEISYNKYNRYAQTKLANILFARELAKRLRGTGVTANSLHPGVILTDIGRELGWFIVTFIVTPICKFAGKTTEQGAQTSIYLAVSEDVAGVSGLYFVDCKEAEPSKYAEDDGVAKKLWEVSADLVGLDTTI